MTISTEQFITVNTGSVANDGSGDSLREAFIKLNENFANISDVGFDAGNINVQGSIESQGNITAPYFIGSGALLTGLNLGSITEVGTLSNLTVSGNITASSNLTVSGDITASSDLTVSGNITSANVLATAMYCDYYLLSNGSEPMENYPGNISVGGNLVVTDNYTPSTASSAGTAGQIAWDSSHVYICVATNSWKRANLSTW